MGPSHVGCESSLHEGTGLWKTMTSLGKLQQSLEIGGFEGSHKEEHTKMFGENSNVLAQAKTKSINDFLVCFGVSLAASVARTAKTSRQSSPKAASVSL